MGVGLAQAWFEVAGLVAGLHAWSQAIATIAVMRIAADQYRSFNQGYFDLIFILPDIELGAGHSGLALGGMDHEWMLAIVLDLEERLALDQGDPAFVLVVGEAQRAAQVQLDLATVVEHYMADGVAAFQVLVMVRQPALLPADPRPCRQGQQRDGGG
ncbi:hypothetical protein D3C72_1846810 [compost metagenome]